MIVYSMWRGPIETRLSMPVMAQEIASLYGITIDELRGQDRHKRVVEPRQHFMWLAHKQPHLSLSMIGGYLNGRDHSTCTHGIKKHQARINAKALEVAA